MTHANCNRIDGVDTTNATKSGTVTDYRHTIDLVSANGLEDSVGEAQRPVLRKRHGNSSRLPLTQPSPPSKLGGEGFTALCSALLPFPHSSIR